MSACGAAPRAIRGLSTPRLPFHTNPLPLLREVVRRLSAPFAGSGLSDGGTTEGFGRGEQVGRGRELRRQRRQEVWGEFVELLDNEKQKEMPLAYCRPTTLEARKVIAVPISVRNTLMKIAVWRNFATNTRPHTFRNLRTAHIDISNSISHPSVLLARRNKIRELLNNYKARHAADLQSCASASCEYGQLGQLCPNC